MQAQLIYNNFYNDFIYNDFRYQASGAHYTSHNWNDPT